MRPMIAAILLSITSPVLAQAPAPAAVEPDAALLVAATRLVEIVMPLRLRDQMVTQMAGGMLDNMTRMMTASPQMPAMFAKEPRARPIFERYMATVGDDARRMMREMMPEMQRVLARAYARRLTASQIAVAHDFYAGPSGQAFALAATGVMTDPEYGAMVQSMMARAMERAPAQAQAMRAELQALGSPATAK